MQNILLTGANGFIGQTLCRAFLRNGYRVRAALRSPERRTDEFKDMDCFFVGDIGPDTDWGPALAGVEAVVHVAGRAHVLHETAKNPSDEYKKTNTEGTRRLARQAVHAGVRKFIFLSTVKVNGEENKNRPFIELDQPSPHDDYAKSKWEGENFLHEMASQNKFEVVVIRMPLVYGPGVKGNFLRLLDLVQSGMFLPFSLVDNRRSFIYSENLADAVISCLDYRNNAYEVFFVSDGRDVSIPELIRTIAKALNRPARLVPVPLSFLWSAGHMVDLIEKLSRKELLVDTEKIRRVIGSLAVDSHKISERTGWAPRYSLQEGLQATAEWYLKNRK